MCATDVCPLVPIANINMNECVKWAHKLGERVGKELKIPIYHYEAAAKEEKRKNLAQRAPTAASVTEFGLPISAIDFITSIDL